MCKWVKYKMAYCEDDEALWLLSNMDVMRNIARGDYHPLLFISGTPFIMYTLSLNTAKINNLLMNLINENVIDIRSVDNLIDLLKKSFFLLSSVSTLTH